MTTLQLCHEILSKLINEGMCVWVSSVLNVDSVDVSSVPSVWLHPCKV